MNGFQTSLVMAGAGNLAVHLGQAGAEFVVGFVAAGEADDLHAGRQFAIDGEVVEGRDELAVGEVAGGAEDDDGARLRHRAGDEVFAEGIAHGEAGVSANPRLVAKTNQESVANAIHGPQVSDGSDRLPGGSDQFDLDSLRTPVFPRGGNDGESG